MRSITICDLNLSSSSSSSFVIFSNGGQPLYSLDSCWSALRAALSRSLSVLSFVHFCFAAVAVRVFVLHYWRKVRKWAELHWRSLMLWEVYCCTCNDPHEYTRVFAGEAHNIDTLLPVFGWSHIHITYRIHPGGLVLESNRPFGWLLSARSLPFVDVCVSIFFLLARTARLILFSPSRRSWYDHIATSIVSSVVEQASKVNLFRELFLFLLLHVELLICVFRIYSNKRDTNFLIEWSEIRLNNEKS